MLFVLSICSSHLFSTHLSQGLQSHCSCHCLGMFLVWTRCLWLVVHTVQCDLDTHTHNLLTLGVPLCVAMQTVQWTSLYYWTTYWQHTLKRKFLRWSGPLWWTMTNSGCIIRLLLHSSMRADTGCFPEHRWEAGSQRVKQQQGWTESTIYPPPCVYQ